MPGFRTLYEGQRISFDIDPGQKGPCCKNSLDNRYFSP